MEDVKVSNLGYSWIELDTQDILRDAFLWRPLRSKIKETICDDCRHRIAHIQDVAKKWGIEGTLFTPRYDRVENSLTPESMIADTDICFKCRNEIPVFWWKEVPYSTVEPPRPFPETIKKIYSDDYDIWYWGNTCAHCHNKLSEYHLFLKYGGVFNELPHDENKISKILDTQTEEWCRKHGF